MIVQPSFLLSSVATSAVVQVPFELSRLAIVAAAFKSHSSIPRVAALAVIHARQSEPRTSSVRPTSLSVIAARLRNVSES